MSAFSAMSDFPFFKLDNNKITSPQTSDYNCIGWAAGEDDRFWWPNNHPFYYWPISPVPNVTIGAFVEAFATLDYAPCINGELEQGIEKVVLYVDQNFVPTHMARQLLDGTWTSKLGNSFDIMHTTPEVVDGPCYGKAHLFLSRPRRL